MSAYLWTWALFNWHTTALDGIARVDGRPGHFGSSTLQVCLNLFPSSLILTVVGGCFPFFRWYSWRISSYVFLTHFPRKNGYSLFQGLLFFQTRVKKFNTLELWYKWIIIFGKHCISCCITHGSDLFKILTNEILWINSTSLLKFIAFTKWKVI